MLLLSDGVIVTQVLNHVRQTADCVAEQNIKLLYLWKVTAHWHADRFFGITEASA